MGHDIEQDIAEGRLVQIGWFGCDCPPYERSPHANSKPVYAEPDKDGED